MVCLKAILFVAAALSLIGLLGMLLRKNLVIMLMSLELMVLGGVLALVGAAHYQTAQGSIDGGVFVPFIFIIAACEVTIGLSLIMVIFRKEKTIWVDDINDEKT